MVPSDSHGVGHWRNIWPAQSLEKHYGDEFELEINIGPNVENMAYLKQFDIIHFHRNLGPAETQEKVFAELRAAGVTLVMDIDDYWAPSSTHPLYEVVKNEKLTEKILGTLKIADYVTCTTDIFAEHIKKHNKNVFVIPNAIDSEHAMWKSEVQPNQTDKCRISWIGGSSHMNDLNLISHSMNLLYNNKELKDKFQLIMCGFDTRGTITEVSQDGSRNTRNILPHETIWCKFEEIFTNKYSYLKTEDPEYYKWLLKIKREDYEDQYKKSYVRRWTLPLTQYGKHYDYCDVTLAPIQEIDRVKIMQNGEVINENDPRPGTMRSIPNYFNLVKSELKIVEAGMKKKCIIAQDFGIYKELIKDGVNGILVKDNKDGWYKAMRKVILDKDYRESLANNLHEWVKNTYEMKIVSAHRVQFYRDLYNLKKEKRNSYINSLSTAQII
jgi:glycosyltransferase involved in cell wall biosynthesis